VIWSATDCWEEQLEAKCDEMEKAARSLPCSPLCEASSDIR